MDPATSAVMVLFWCSPDMLLCRRPATETPQPIYKTSSECDEALKARLASPHVGGRIVIGRCQEAESRSAAISWGISPNRELLTSLAPAQLPVLPAPVDDVTTASTSSPDKAAVSEYTTVRVTHGTGNNAVTTSYVVKRSN